ncbi:LacI family transcriptional regulator [Curtobacterium flaccumfaciens]|uniref:LacI family transcriptional regulator n=1 Tax=Curtobacterium flaccumfaciens TaxID=2035 RepID=A0A4R6DJN8_9MICO|nr:LacI family DNA-binding transcriptional regulator [Curtobacterium flaccumfaciens]TDN44614.1 LacI family transcriptional regulator [Curtobacterium flaccumfaciens]
MSTYKDIQQATGLSLATISKYYNGRNVLAANREAIEAAARELDFRPNQHARMLRSRQSRTVGVLLPALDNDFHLTIIAGVEEALRPRGISVIVAASPDPADDPVSLLMDRMVDGIVAVTAPHDVPALRAAATRVPVVMVDWHIDDIDADGVFIDNVAAGALGARHLLDHGHRRIGFVGGNPTISSMRLRTEGFERALTAHGTPVDRALERLVPLTVDAGYRAAQELLAMWPRPTGLFTANYELTLGAVTAVNDSGLRIGRDISVVGFDSRELAQALVPKLTVIVQPTREIARHAARLIADHIELPGGRPAPTIEYLEANLLPGASVARLNE